MENYFDKFNKGNSTVREGIDTKKMEFKPLKEFIGQTIGVDGFFFTTGRYGEQVVLVGANGYLINMPKRAAEEMRVIEKDEKAMELLMAGNMAITDIAEKDTKNGRTVAWTYCMR